MIALRLEVPMSTEPTPPSRRDVYSPDDVRWMLAHYHDLHLPLGRREDRIGRVQANRPKNADPEKDRVLRRAMIDMALTWLLVAHPAEANTIASYYCDRWPVDRVAEADGITERAAYQRIERGIHRMAIHLGWRPRAGGEWAERIED